MKFPVLWSGLCCYTEGWGGKCSEILATIKLLYNPRVNKVFTSQCFVVYGRDRLLFCVAVVQSFCAVRYYSDNRIILH